MSPGLGEKEKQGVILSGLWGYSLAIEQKKPRFKMFCFGEENGVYVMVICENRQILVKMSGQTYFSQVTTKRLGTVILYGYRGLLGPSAKKSGVVGGLWRSRNLRCCEKSILSIFQISIPIIDQKIFDRVANRWKRCAISLRFECIFYCNF
jgi:hypothetical protein